MSEVSEPLKNRVVVFSLDEQRYGLPLEAVDSVVRMVEVTPIPDLPGYIHGVVNVHGTIMAVINLRRRMCLKDRPEILEDKLIIARCHDRHYAFMVDGVSEVLSIKEQDILEAGAVLPEQGFLTGIAKMQDGMILLNNPDALMVLGDRDQIDGVLGKVTL